MTQRHRNTKLIATLGPSINKKESLREIIALGTNVLRVNMSHATHEEVRSLVRSIKDISQDLGKNVSILMDTQGPEIRTGCLDSKIALKTKETVFVNVRGDSPLEEKSFDVNYQGLIDDIEIGNLILVDNGQIELKVLEKYDSHFKCEVLNSGEIGSRRHINVPGVKVNIPGLTDKDKEDVALGLELGVDYFAMSFVRSAENVESLRAIIRDQKAQTKIIAKIEDGEGVKNIDSIVDASDGVMVARGDLGVEIPYEDLPIRQKEIIVKCKRKGKLVIVATHMLESMIENPAPTRAEISDIAFAVYDQVDAIMLSGETSVGKYPQKCIGLMNKIAERVESTIKIPYNQTVDIRSSNDKTKLMKSACVLINDLQAQALLLFTRKGSTVASAAWMRPTGTKIFAFTDNELLYNQLPLYWGINAYLIEAKDNIRYIIDAVDFLKKKGLVSIGEQVVVAAETIVDDQVLDSIQIKKVY